MNRRTIAFSPTQEDFMAEETERLGIPINELVRRALDWYIDTYPVAIHPNKLAKLLALIEDDDEI